MKRHDVVRALGIVLTATALASGSPGPARASTAPVDSAARAPRLASVPPDSLRALRVASDTLGADWLALRRAVAARRVGDTRAMIAALEPLDWSKPGFAEADRAAFLLGLGYLEQGTPSRFVALARQVEGWPDPTPFTRWLGYQRAILESQGMSLAPDTTASAPDSTLERLAASSPALQSFLKARAVAAQGGDEEREWIELAADTTTRLGRDLAGEALLRQAGRILDHGGDPTALLRSVPPGSRYSSRARHLLGLLALEKGDSSAGTSQLESLLALDSSYAEARAVRMALASQRLDARDWAAAEQAYAAVDRDWSNENAALRAMLESGNFDSLWTAWAGAPAGSPTLALDADAARVAAESLAVAAEDLTQHPMREPPPLDASALAPWRWTVAPPTAEASRQVTQSERQLEELRYERDGARRDVERERAELAERQRYLSVGLERSQGEMRLLSDRAAQLDSLRRTLGALNQQLAAVRDSATLHLGRRLERIVRTALTHELWMNGMRFYYLSDPALQRTHRLPQGFPSADSMLAAEQGLARAIEAVAESMVIATPSLIARSYRDSWRPGLITRSDSLGIAAGQLLSRARALGGNIDSCLTATSSSPALRLEERRLAWLESSADSMEVRHRALRSRTATEAVEAALDAMNDEREGIDYGLASSRYGLAIQLGVPDSLELPAAAAGHENDSTSLATDVEEPAQAAEWRMRAIESLQTFLGRHPESPARGEVRFRLADLMLVDARQQFREQMAAYLKAQAAGQPTGHLPQLSDRTALDLYVAILKQDPDFPHRDAVLFNAAMILADDGDPAAVPYFQELVSSFPESPYCQESYLRMADLNFNDRDFASGVTLYQRAAAGGDTSLAVTALYKMGWAEYNAERYLQAVDAFRRVLDLYDAPGHAPIQVDVHKEAESDLIQAMARAGGAPAFAMYFDTLGTRPYEMKLLMSLAAYQRRYSLFADAAASEELALTRYPLAPEALENAQLLAETYRRWEKPDQVRDAQLKYASQFAPGSDWARAQASDSVRTAGSEFARGGLKSVALEHHLEARKTNSAWEWREALQLYDTILSHWPDDPDAPALHLNAGEACASVGDYPAALAHYAAAAKGGPDSTAQLALWQEVAVTDSWYEASRSAGTGPHPLGSDSLATAVMSAADQLLQRYPQHPRAADLLWREGNLAFAHRWYDRSAEFFGKFATQHPSDSRAPLAAMLRADSYLRLDQFDQAGAAYAAAMTAARTAGVDSLARRAERAIPICAYRQAEAAVAADSTAYAKHAELFEKVATSWPGYEHADLAEYRAGLAYQKAGKTEASVNAMQNLILHFPNSEFLRDAHLQIAKQWEEKGEKARAAQGYEDFVKAFPQDSVARDAWLKAADLYAGAGLTDRADQLHLAYVHRYPDDVAAAMDFLEDLARRELKTVSPSHPISTLIPPPAPIRSKLKKGVAAAAPVASASSEPPSHLAQYLKLAAAHPDLASKPLIAEIRFDQGEESFAAYSSAAIRQPLEKSIPAKQKLLDQVLSRFRECVNVGVAEWSHAATYRIGEALVGFGDALQKSERPADIKGDDLTAYDQVLHQQAQPFYDRGEGVWAELLRQRAKDSSDDSWMGKAQESLFQRMSDRFYYRPETDYPLAAAVAADKVHPAKSDLPSRAHGGKSKSSERAEAKSHRGSRGRTASMTSQGSEP